MPRGRNFGKLYRIFTNFMAKMPRRSVHPAQGSGKPMVAIAATMFIALFGWGQEYFHWSDPAGKIQLALFTSFVLGIICGYKTKQ